MKTFATMNNNSTWSYISTAYNISNNTDAGIGEINEFDVVADNLFLYGQLTLTIFGTIGNILSFLVMRRRSLKNVSTCYYMSMLALADTGNYETISPNNFTSKVVTRRVTVLGK